MDGKGAAVRPPAYAPAVLHPPPRGPGVLSFFVLGAGFTGVGSPGAHLTRHNFDSRSETVSGDSDDSAFDCSAVDDLLPGEPYLRAETPLPPPDTQEKIWGRAMGLPNGTPPLYPPKIPRGEQNPPAPVCSSATTSDRQ